MPKAVEPPGDYRVEYDTYSDLAERLGVANALTAGRTEEDWLRVIWADT